MKKNEATHLSCAICGKSFFHRQVISAEIIRKEITKEIIKVIPNWESSMYICQADLTVMRAKYVKSLLESEKGELNNLESEVLKSLQNHELLSTDIDATFDKEWTFGERLTDKIASFGGSWYFLICFGLFLFIWITINALTFFWSPAVDPYPFILLNLMLSCLAAMQAPIIMMSQNRQEVKDRLRSQHDYKVNLKAELEIRHLHEKMDHLLSHQWERLVEIQQIQIELLSELNNKKQ
jgi:uncharacterized membrane protein